MPTLTATGTWTPTILPDIDIEVLAEAFAAYRKALATWEACGRAERVARRSVEPAADLDRAGSMAALSSGEAYAPHHETEARAKAAAAAAEYDAAERLCRLAERALVQAVQQNLREAVAEVRQQAVEHAADAAASLDHAEQMLLRHGAAVTAGQWLPAYAENSKASAKFTGTVAHDALADARRLLGQRE